MKHIGSWVTWAVGIPIGFVLLFKIMAAVIPEAQTAGNVLNATAGLPLKSLFASNGVVFILLMAGAIIMIVYSVMPKGKHR